MPVYEFQANLQLASGLPEDVFINTFFFDVAGTFDPVTPLPGDITEVAQDLRDGYITILGPFMNPDIETVEVKVYELGPNPTGPRYTTKANANFNAVQGGPAEVACCLSYASVDDPLASLPRRRGRIFIGPLAGSHTNSDRPGTALVDAVLDFGEYCGAIGTANGVTWHLYSRTDQASAKIESIWVDDAWDTQRRRGLRPTTRTVRDVQ